MTNNMLPMVFEEEGTSPNGQCPEWGQASQGGPAMVALAFWRVGQGTGRQNPKCYTHVNHHKLLSVQHPG